MSDSQVFLPVINENQYNLLISLANTYLRENLSNLLILARDGMANPLFFDNDQAVATINEADALKTLMLILDDKAVHIKCASAWPIRIALPSATLSIIRTKLLAIHQRYQSMLSSPGTPMPTHSEWWQAASGIDPKDHTDLMILIGSLEAISAQVPLKFSGTTIMTGLSD